MQSMPGGRRGGLRVPLRVMKSCRHACLGVARRIPADSPTTAALSEGGVGW
ncbi:AAA family ATPase, partial [Myxococcus xanthus]|nr:AAA family ATPase [Myxococcus xanthus]